MFARGTGVRTIAAAVIAVPVLAGCSGPHRTTKTTLLGTGVGAGVGAIAGGSKGTAIGAGAGALSGFLLGLYEDKREDKLRREEHAYPPPEHYYSRTERQEAPRPAGPVEHYERYETTDPAQYEEFLRWKAERNEEYQDFVRWRAENPGQPRP